MFEAGEKGTVGGKGCGVGEGVGDDGGGTGGTFGGVPGQDEGETWAGGQVGAEDEGQVEEDAGEGTEGTGEEEETETAQDEGEEGQEEAGGGQEEGLHQGNGGEFPHCGERQAGHVCSSFATAGGAAPAEQEQTD